MECKKCEDSDEGKSKDCETEAKACFKLDYENKDGDKMAYRGCYKGEDKAEDHCHATNETTFKDIYPTEDPDTELSEWGEMCLCVDDDCNSASIYGMSTLLMVAAAFVRYLH